MQKESFEMGALIYNVALVTISGFLLLCWAGIGKASSSDLPTLTPEDAEREDKLTIFVDTFLKGDLQAKQLLNPSNLALYAKGYRPTIGVFHDPEKNAPKIPDLKRYFTKKLYLDLKALRPFTKQTFQTFINEIGRASDQTLMCAGEIAMKYNLQVEGRFIFEKELSKIPEGAEKERLKQCWLNDFILGTELRMLAWVYRQFFGEVYLNPERRH
jgi:hypothetical protein